ncbi:hypothetical protein BES34_016935 [Leptospira inadai serovar Lyme]|uniref:Uncharacterized protein n=1 Tax=Leptospira inadai serovar Lyme TaxID=293084 RepID=A0ABX4YEY2_9LEPT|nr:hypothetical protein BES34_016935 [Leptospira inadai serovar Lyme]
MEPFPNQAYRAYPFQKSRKHRVWRPGSSTIIPLEPNDRFFASIHARPIIIGWTQFYGNAELHYVFRKFQYGRFL